ncbi:hypothetical protein SAMN02799631_04339 [Methylobacterium sp. 174MFSha1.1]|uniref:hypothetical protein n=1 Tax=Methylobacterium sp. 174MFSha1.1 TaxID=1502749 RepID=UPI0008EF3CA6|nr:hypothetical protein [Methylobacterium sp. 174MFSha1.1]SFV06027.1 hypothetical protein SAMN02799631_04339 [Methylobacterium sp. 174MFSha1.1]
MPRRVFLVLCALVLASVQAHAQMLPGRGPGFRPGFQFFGNVVYDADFTTGTYSAGPPTITRASPGYAADSAGAYTSFAADTLRRTNAGATVEPTDTSIVRNNSMQGAAAGSPGTFPSFWTSGVNGSGLVWSVAGLGVESGIDYIDLRLSGSASSASEAFVFFEVNATTGIAAQNQLWTESAFIRQSAGTLTNVNALRLRQNTNTGSFTGGDFRASLGASSIGLNRQAYSLTLADAATNYVRPMMVVGHNAGAVDITLRVGWPHLSQAARALSPIRTTSGAVTRQADVVTLPVAGVGRVVITYDDGGTQVFTGIPTGTPWTIPAANLNRSAIRRLTGYAS